jgi:hypothetical protein
MSIMAKIFGAGTAQAAPTAGGSGASSQASGTPGTTASSAAQTSAPAGTGATPGQGVDVDAVLRDLAAKSGQKLDHRHSIVDLMKLLGLDSSVTARKELAQELHYTGDTSDSAAMNVWLHKQVMRKLAENGGKVPDDLKN